MVQVVVGMECCEMLAERREELCWISGYGDWMWEKEWRDTVTKRSCIP